MPPDDPEPRPSARDQILDAAAALFAAHGFAATSTRAIAERVGIRQASLYHHFAGKDDILEALLTTSVRPSLQVVRAIEDRAASAAAALHALATADVETLVRTPHNIGTLYLAPEVQDERFAPFRAERQQLQDAYGRLGIGAASPQVVATVTEEQLGAVLIQLAELVIQLRRRGDLHATDRDVIAATCLRACGLSGAAITEARQEAELLRAAVLAG